MTGTFPFGTKAERCEPRGVDDADLFVLGVYPSALHIRWASPSGVTVRAMAVAPEPYPFWPGDDAEDRVRRWLDDNWRAAWGTATNAGRVNGSSGRWVREQVVAALAIPWRRVWLSDALPFFHVKRGQGQQGAAMSERYDPWAAQVADLAPHRLPDRPSPTVLVQQALATESDRLRQEIVDSRAPLIVSLGNEALGVMRGIVDPSLANTLPDRLRRDVRYGTRYEIEISGRQVALLPLVHPGQSGVPWRQAHARWTEVEAHDLNG